jgi:hypothetical protein
MGIDRKTVCKVCALVIPAVVSDSFALLQTLRGYLDAEHRNKKKKPFDFSGWEDYILEVRTLMPQIVGTNTLSPGCTSAGKRIRLWHVHMLFFRSSIQR